MNLGKFFSVITSPKGLNEKYIYEFDEDTWKKDISLNWQDYPCEQENEIDNKHYTEIIIKKLRSKIDAFGRRVENKIISDFGLRYAYMIKNGDVILSILDQKNRRITIEPNFPDCEKKSKQNFDFLLDKNDPNTRIYGWVGLRWDTIRQKVIGSQKGNYGFITYRNGRLITLYDDLKVDSEIFAMRRHPQWATIIGVVNMDCVPVENDKRNFIQESPSYIEAIKKIRDYVKIIEKEIKDREGESDIAEDIKEITEELVNASEKALEDKDIKALVKETADEEGLKSYGRLIKRSVSGKLIRSEKDIIDEKEFRRSMKKQIGTVVTKKTGKIRKPKKQITRGKIKEIEKIEYPEGILEIDIENQKIKVKHSYVNSLTGDALRSWEVTEQGFFLVKTNINHISDLTGKEFPVFALHNICESLSEFCLNLNESDKIIQMRDELIKKTYNLISELS